MDAFQSSLGIFPAGTLISLRAETLGIVVADNETERTRPTVRSFYSVYAKARIAPADIRIGSSNSLKLKTPADWGFDDWDRLSNELLRTVPC